MENKMTMAEMNQRLLEAEQKADEMQSKAAQAESEAREMRKAMEAQRGNALQGMAEDLVQFIKDEEIDVVMAYDLYGPNSIDEESSYRAIELYENHTSVEMSLAYERKGRIGDRNVDEVNNSYRDHETVKVSLYIPRERVAHLIEKNFG